jgi:hypothetical protein
VDEMKQMEAMCAAVPPPDEETLARARARVLNAVGGPASWGTRRGWLPLREPRWGRLPRRRLITVPRLALTGSLVIAAAAMVTVAMVRPAGPGPATRGTRPAGANRPTAAMLLAKIADAAQRQPAPAVRGGEFMYIRSEVAYPTDTIVNGHETSASGMLHERQVWLPVANICATGLLIEQGVSTPLSAYPIHSGHVVQPPPGSGFLGCGEGTVGDPTYRLLQSLPADPATLLKLIYAKTKGEGPSPAAEAFTTIGNLIGETIVPPRTAAALYRAAALIPGATVVEHATDAVGRSGIAVAWTAGRYRDEWIFNSATLQYLGERDYDTATGTVSGESAVLQRAFVGKAGQLP